MTEDEEIYRWLRNVSTGTAMYSMSQPLVSIANVSGYVTYKVPPPLPPGIEHENVGPYNPRFPSQQVPAIVNQTNLTRGKPSYEEPTTWERIARFFRNSNRTP